MRSIIFLLLICHSLCFTSFFSLYSRDNIQVTVSTLQPILQFEVIYFHRKQLLTFENPRDTFMNLNLFTPVYSNLLLSLCLKTKIIHPP